jgi:phage host-nuclease inhibitor protein Gam
MGTTHVEDIVRSEIASELAVQPLAVPPETYVGDAETDLAILKSIPHQFCIEDEKTANWLVRRVQSARQYAQRVKEWSEHEMRRAEREETTLMFLFGRQIERWTKTEVSKLKGKRKSINLPSGAVGFRTLASRLVIDDETVVLKWAKFHLPSAVVITEKLSKSVVNEHAEKVGEIPDSGVHIEPSSEKFFIR